MRQDEGKVKGIHAPVVVAVTVDFVKLDSLAATTHTAGKTSVVYNEGCPNLTQAFIFFIFNQMVTTDRAFISSIIA